MAWYLRAVELADGSWACRWGTTEYDTHDLLDDTLSHLHELGEKMGPYSLVIHRHGFQPVLHEAHDA